MWTEPANKVRMYWGGSNGGDTGPNWKILADDYDVQVKQSVRPQYIDITQGIRTTENTNTLVWKNGYKNSAATITVDCSDPKTDQWIYIKENGLDLRMNIEYQNGKLIVFALDGSGNREYSWMDSWRFLEIRINTLEQSLMIVPVKSPNHFARFDFTNYEVEEAAARNLSSVFSTMQPATFTEMKFVSTKNDTKATYGVTSTDVFMETYGAVMSDPDLDITSYFQQFHGYQNFKIHIQSVALSGTELRISVGAGSSASMTITDGLIYVDGQPHQFDNMIIYSDIKTGSAPAVYVEFLDEEGHKPIKIIDGSAGFHYTDLQMSGTGKFAFNTYLYEGYPSTITKTEFDVTNFSFDGNATILFFFGMLIVGALIGKRYAGLGALDLLIIACAGICGFVLLV